MIEILRNRRSRRLPRLACISTFLWIFSTSPPSTRGSNVIYGNPCGMQQDGNSIFIENYQTRYLEASVEAIEAISRSSWFVSSENLAQHKKLWEIPGKRKAEGSPDWCFSLIRKWVVAKSWNTHSKTLLNPGNKRHKCWNDLIVDSGKIMEYTNS